VMSSAINIDHFGHRAELAIKMAWLAVVHLLSSSAIQPLISAPYLKVCGPCSQPLTVFIFLITPGGMPAVTCGNNWLQKSDPSRLAIQHHLPRRTQITNTGDLP
jgi:hypothetical protein